MVLADVADELFDEVRAGSGRGSCSTKGQPTESGVKISQGVRFENSLSSGSAELLPIA